MSNINASNKVNKSRNYYHSDMKYANPKLIDTQTKMFSHYLNQFDKKGHRKYNAMDAILDIPKIKLFQPKGYYQSDKQKNLKENVRKVEIGETRIRNCVAQFIQSPIVKHCCLGVMANFEQTAYRPKFKSKFYDPNYGAYHNGHRNNKYYFAKYNKFHPHVHLTFIVKPHTSYKIDNVYDLHDSLIAQKTQYTRDKKDRNYKDMKQMKRYTVDDMQFSKSAKKQTLLSSGDCALMNKAWNNAIEANRANIFANGKYTIPKDMNHFYLKPTYIKANKGHVKAYWSAGFANSYSDLLPICFAKPLSRTINDNDSKQTIQSVAHDLSSESNKYRGLNKDFYQDIQKDNPKQALRTTFKNLFKDNIQKETKYYRNSRQFQSYKANYDYSKQHNDTYGMQTDVNIYVQHMQKMKRAVRANIINEANDLYRNENGLKAIYHGYIKKRNQYPRHFYFGKLRDYAQRYIYPKFKTERNGEKYLNNYLKNNIEQGKNHKFEQKPKTKKHLKKKPIPKKELKHKNNGQQPTSHQDLTIG